MIALNPGRWLTLGLLLVAGTILTSWGCAERVADCVEVYANTGATRRAGFTKTACEDHCNSIQGWIDCYWDGRIAAEPLSLFPAPSLNEVKHLSRVRVPPGPELGVDQVAVYADLKGTARALNQLD